MTDQPPFEQAEQVPTCACGEPAAPGVVHRTGAPCYYEQPVSQPSPLPILRYFDFTHLPEPLRQVSAEFASLAMYVADYLPPGPEQRVALRKLLEAKDAAVRAALDLPRPVPPTPLVDPDVCCGASGSQLCEDAQQPAVPAGDTAQGEGVASHG